MLLSVLVRIHITPRTEEKQRSNHDLPDLPQGLQSEERCRFRVDARAKATIVGTCRRNHSFSHRLNDGEGSPWKVIFRIASTDTRRLHGGPDTSTLILVSLWKVGSCSEAAATWQPHQKSQETYYWTYSIFSASGNHYFTFVQYKRKCYFPPE